MLKRFMMSVAVVLILSVGAVGAVGAGVAEGDIVTRMDFPGDEAMGTIHVEAKIDAAPAKVWGIISNVNAWKGMMPLVIETQFLSAAAAQAIPANPPKDEALFAKIRAEHPGTSAAPGNAGVTTRMAYESYDLPWPIANEWVVRQYTFDASKGATGTFRATWKKVFNNDSAGPDGYWLLEPFPGQPETTKLTYHYRVKAKRGLTLALFKSGMKSTVTKMIEAIRVQSAR